MRRAQAILVILALLAAPLALLARSAAGSMSGCAGMCCPIHGSHAARVLHEKMLCHHGEAGHFFECAITPGHHGIDYGLIAPLAPTAPSLASSIKFQLLDFFQRRFNLRDASLRFAVCIIQKI
jgi:hypothetical protein